MADLLHLRSGPKPISDSQVNQMALEIERDGFCCVPHYVGGLDLMQMREFALAAIGQSGKASVALKGKDPFVGTRYEEFSESANFKDIFSRLYQITTKKPPPEVTFYQVLRCLTGHDIAKESFVFHYDSFLITALIPIIIPTKGQRGNFIMFPNTRRIRSNYLSNLIDKILVDNKISQAALKQVARFGLFGIKRIPLVPGNLYFFWGYRSIHTNEPCDPDQLRSTALFHFADPHADSPLKARLRR